MVEEDRRNSQYPMESATRPFSRETGRKKAAHTGVLTIKCHTVKGSHQVQLESGESRAGASSALPRLRVHPKYAPLTAVSNAVTQEQGSCQGFSWGLGTYHACLESRCSTETTLLMRSQTQ